MSPDPASHVQGIVHEETQRESPGFDLTLSAVAEVTSPGSVDFGGGELAPGEMTRRQPEKRHAEDDYGWWTLESGQYLIEHNESLDAPEPLVLQTRDEILTRGAFHPTLLVDALHPMPLTVGAAGIHLKENARISTLLSPSR